MSDAQDRHGEDVPGAPASRPALSALSIHSARHYSWGERCDGWHLLAEPGVSVIEERMPPGTAERRHHHARAAQLFYVLAGEASFEVAGATRRIGARTAIHIVPGTPHCVANEGDCDLEFLVVSVPPSHGDRVNE